MTGVSEEKKSIVCFLFCWRRTILTIFTNAMILLLLLLLLLLLYWLKQIINDTRVGVELSCL